MNLAAIPALNPGCELVVTVDTMNAGVHFYADVPAEQVADKLVAVNMSDLASSGAEPLAVMVSLSGEDRADWFAVFNQRLEQLADSYGFGLLAVQQLPGQLSATLQAYGQVPAGEVLLRSGARAGDHVCVTGTPGDAGIALQLIQQGKEPGDYLRGRLQQPQPRLGIGRQLRSLATACIDVSDGLSADLGHILDASSCGAELRVEQVPLSDEALQAASRDAVLAAALGAGDDYELCFTVPDQSLSEVLALDQQISCIGRIVPGRGLSLLLEDGSRYDGDQYGYQHF